MNYYVSFALYYYLTILLLLKVKTHDSKSRDQEEAGYSYIMNESAI